jgi:hypothetical protein
MDESMVVGDISYMGEGFSPRSVAVHCIEASKYLCKVSGVLKGSERFGLCHEGPAEACCAL